MSDGKTAKSGASELPKLTRSHALTQLSATQLAQQIAAGEISSVEVVDAHIRQIEAVNPRLNAVVVPMFESARAEARMADQARSRGEPLGLLHGVPMTVKECYHVAGTVSCIGVDRFRDEVIATDGPLVQRLRRAGAIILGKTNVPQAMLLHETENPVYGRTNNPWNLDRSPGGSSGGEAAIIAAGGSPLGLANDLGGSIRQPAHVCGLCGIKPTTGRFTNTGCRNNLSGLKLIATQSGAIARHMVDLQLVLRVLNQRAEDDPKYEDELDHPLGDPAEIDVARLRIGVFSDDGFFTPSPAVRRAVDEAALALRSIGAEVVPFQPPDVSEAISLYFSLIGADGAQALRQVLDGSRIDRRIGRMIGVGKIAYPWRGFFAQLAAIFAQPRAAQLLRSTGRKTSMQLEVMAGEIEAYKHKFSQVMDAAGVDALVFPPHALAAPRHGSTFDLPPAASYCFVPNLLGIPAGTVACTRVRAGEESDRRFSIDRAERAAAQVERGSTGLPIGVQVAARHWREDIVLAVMAALERTFATNADYPAEPPAVA